MSELCAQKKKCENTESLGSTGVVSFSRLRMIDTRQFYMT